MLELAVHLDSAGLPSQKKFLATRRLQDIRTEGLAVRGFEGAAWTRLLESLPQEILRRSCTRVYLGSEFCPGLADSTRELDGALGLLRREGLDATLVLGPIRQTSMASTMARLRSAARRMPSLEVVANDWGTLAKLSPLGVVPVLGRFLFRMKRLPRFSSTTRPVPATKGWRQILAAQMGELSRCPADIPWFAELLRSLKANRMDTEVVPQGVGIGGHPACKLSLLLPWTYVTGGGNCPVSGVAQADGLPRCLRACRESWIVRRFPYPTWPMVQVGHTVFADMAPLIGSYLRRGIYDRYVLEPRLPM